MAREEVTAFEAAEALSGLQRGEPDMRGKDDRECAAFLDAAACARRSVRNSMLADRVTRSGSVWRIINQFAIDAETAEPHVLGLSRALHTQTTRNSANGDGLRMPMVPESLTRRWAQ